MEQSRHNNPILRLNKSLFTRPNRDLLNNAMIEKQNSLHPLDAYLCNQLPKKKPELQYIFDRAIFVATPLLVNRETIWEELSTSASTMATEGTP